MSIAPPRWAAYSSKPGTKQPPGNNIIRLCAYGRGTFYPTHTDIEYYFLYAECHFEYSTMDDMNNHKRHRSMAI